MTNKKQSALLSKNDEAFQSLEAALKASQGLTAHIRVDPLPGDQGHPQRAEVNPAVGAAGAQLIT